LWLRVQAKPRMGALDLACVTGLGFALLSLLAIALTLLPETAPAENAAHGGRRLQPGHALPLLAIACVYLAMQWPSQGALETLFKGVLLFGLQVGLAWLFVRAAREPGSSLTVRRLRALGMRRMVRPKLTCGAAVLAVPALVAVAKLSLRFVPSTGEAPLQTFISWPSGMLSAALLGVLLPAGEELFFRGYVLGALLRYGRALAVLGSTLAFGLMHAEQSWGNWGGLFAVFVTGTILALLRVLGGSTTVCAISHVAYNLTLSASSILVAIGN
jgi:membrane protease YdiL (CAAX protease family)